MSSVTNSFLLLDSCLVVPGEGDGDGGGGGNEGDIKNIEWKFIRKPINCSNDERIDKL